MLSYKSSCEVPWSGSLPSCAPCFTALSSVTPLTLGTFGAQNSMDLSSTGGLGSSPIYRLCGSHILTLEGIVFDSISKTAKIRKHELDGTLIDISGHDYHSLVRCIDRFAVAQKKQPFMASFWRTLLADQWNQGTRLREEVLLHLPISPRTEEEHQILLRHPTLNRHLPFVTGRQLITTDRGLLGLAPEAAVKKYLIIVAARGCSAICLAT